MSIFRSPIFWICAIVTFAVFILGTCAGGPG
jgi:hypothetical protein